VQWARQCLLEKMEISNVGGLGIIATNLVDSQIRDCQLHDIGAGGMLVNGSNTLVANNHIHHVGRSHPSAAAMKIEHYVHPDDEKGIHVYRNEVHDTPYCGIIGAGADHLIEANVVYRAMREMHDGAGIYGNLRNSIIRGNFVRDVVKVGEGTGVSAYYLDEGSADTIIEHNVSVGIERPTHNHLTRNITLRDNVFVADANMIVSFQRSTDCTFTGNTLYAPGAISVSPPNAVKVWAGNLVIRDGLDKAGQPKPFTIDDAMPAATAPGRRAGTFKVLRIAPPPALDGGIGWEQWPGALLALDREPSRWNVGGAPAYARLAYDDQCLYVTVNVVVFDPTQLRKGATWAADDGAEVCIGGDKGTYVLRGFPDRSCQSVTVAGVSPDAAERLGKAVRFVAQPYGKKKDDWKSGWRAQWAIPFEALGITPAPGRKFPFNLGVYRAQDERRLCLEGTLGEDWLLDQAAILEFK